MARIRVPKRIVLELIRKESGDIRVRDAVIKRGGLATLLNYCIPRDREKLERGYVDLRSLTIIGFMGMGKTVFSAHLGRLVKREASERFKEEVLAVNGRSIVDIVEYLRDNKDLLHGLRMLYIFVDDIFYMGLSRESGKPKQLAEKYYSDIRHKFEDIGYTSGILYIVFAGQRLKLVPPFFRSSPVQVFKPLIANDPYERKTLIEALAPDTTHYGRIYAEIVLSMLETAAKLAYTEWRDEAKSFTVIKPGWAPPYIYIQDTAPNPGTVFDIYVPFNYSGVYPEDDLDLNKISSRTKKLVLEAIMKTLLYTNPDYTLDNLKRIIRKGAGLTFDNNMLAEIYRKLKQAINNS